MPFPATRYEMEERGYQFKHAAPCKGCAKSIHWYRTPTGRMMPMDPMDGPDSPAVSHFSTCPEASRFKK